MQSDIYDDQNKRSSLQVMQFIEKYKWDTKVKEFMLKSIKNIDGLKNI